MNTLEQQFQEFNEKHPNVYPKFVEVALTTKRQGFKRYSTKAIIEVVRYFTNITEKGKFKINNNITPIMARVAMEQHPELEGFFETRKSKLDQQKT